MDREVGSIKGVGAKIQAQLHKAGVKTIGELLQYYPRAYRDESNLTKLGSAPLGHLTALVQFSHVTSRRGRSGQLITEAIASDETGSVKTVWFRQPYRQAQLSNGGKFYMTGELAYARGRVSVISPTIEQADTEPVHTARIIPIYRESAGISSRQFRRIIRSALDLGIERETLPVWILKEHSLVDLTTAYRQIHFPDAVKQLAAAKKRLAFDELIVIVLASLLNRRELHSDKAPSINFEAELAISFVKSLPFSLTDSQRKVVWQIYKDMSRRIPMNRLVEGDVGSGKTVIAAMAALMASEQGYQTAFMAPTELLAKQHAETLAELYSAVGKQNNIGLLVGSQKRNAKSIAQKAIKEGSTTVAVGTHALLQEEVQFKNLGLIIVDEQHRFGVEQRKVLEKKVKGAMPHALHMTATPIPRSLALTLYGELDVSQLNEKPPGRKIVKTKVIKEQQLDLAYTEIKSKTDSGEQVFVVCPLIGSGAKNNDYSSVEFMHNHLSSRFPNLNIGILHGRLKTEEKDRAMEKFLNRDTHILVSTTVIEVGVDVPNASLILIMHGDRFGLAQLHQLRGRVGRGNSESLCMIAVKEEAALSRLKTMEHLNDGFKLAEFDMKVRGPGAIYGTLQHGALDLKIAKLSDLSLVREVRKAALKFLEKENVALYPWLLERTDLLRSITYLN